MRVLLIAALLCVCSLVSSAQSSLGAAAGGAEYGARRRPTGSGLTYRVIDGALARRLDNLCAGLWFDHDEVLLIEYRGRTFLLRPNNPGSIGLACKVP